ncbi:MFS transporter, partial [Pseudoxanthobacter sp.]|uniref:MFS transporter n=1 Tax=Pseudoxanthobacter sp. TaxID=1925742 RepID=UPI002FE18F53
AISPAAARRATAFALMAVFLDVIGFGLIIPVLPPLIEDVGHVGLDDAARVGGWLFAAFSLAQFLCAPLMGALADRFGRRPLLLLAIAGLAADYVLHALAPSPGWLFVGRVLAGICGSSYVIANACLADVSAPEKRARAFGLMTAAFGLGFVLGPALGGLISAFGIRAPFWAAAAVAAANFVFGLIALPETLPADRRRAIRWREANPLGVLAVFRRYPGVLPMAVVLVLYFFSTSVYPAIWPFWGMAKFGWPATTVGLTLATTGLAIALMQGLATGPAVARWGERRLAVVGLLFGALSCAGFGLAPTTAAVLVLLLVHALEGFSQPMLAAMMSRAVPDNAQGALQGGLAALMNLAMLAGTLFFTQVFGFFLSDAAPVKSPDIAFFIASAIAAVALAVFVAAVPRRRAIP